MILVSSPLVIFYYFFFSASSANQIHSSIDSRAYGVLVMRSTMTKENVKERNKKKDIEREQDTFEFNIFLNKKSVRVYIHQTTNKQLRRRLERVSVGSLRLHMSQFEVNPGPSQLGLRRTPSSFSVITSIIPLRAAYFFYRFLR